MDAMTSWRSVLLPPERSDGDAPEDLALGVELRARESAESAHWGPRRVRCAVLADLDDERTELSVGLRPLRRAEGAPRWVRGGVSWESLRRGAGTFRGVQRAWFVELYGIAHDVRLLAGLRDDSEWLTLDTVTSPLLWPHLADAVGRGVPLVAAARGQRIVQALETDVSVRIAAAHGGAVRLAPDVVMDGRAVEPASARPIGRSGLYAAETAIDDRGRPEIRVTLGAVPLGDTLHALMSAGGDLVVPGPDTAEFAREVLPRLRRETEVRGDPGVPLPEPAPTTLVLAAQFRPGDRLDYRLEWVRADAEREAWEVRRPDDAHESALRDAVAAAWAHAPDLMFAPAGTLVGVAAAEFAGDVLPALEETDGIRIETRGPRREYRELRGDPRIRVTTVETADADWFDLGVIVEIEGRAIPFAPLFAALALRQKKLLLVDGSYFSLAHRGLDRLRDLLDEASELGEWETGPRISRYQLPLWEEFEDLADEALPARSWRAAAEALRQDGTPLRIETPPGLRADLRPYQREGLDRLALWWRHRLGGILADDMGLGKTLQVLALFAHVRAERGEEAGAPAGPFLVVAPTSVLSTWREEAARFAPGLRVHVHERTAAASGTMPRAADADVVVTSYGLLRHDEALFAAERWAIVVLDEAQFVKNAATRQHRAAKALRADMVLAVTGTPLENSLTELWAILSLTCPGLFPSPRRFREEYVKPIERGKVPENEEGAPYRERRLARLRSRIRPFLLRRTKERVAPELPPRQEQELRVRLSPAHRAVYDTVLQRERTKVLGLLEDLDRHRFIVFRSLTLLRMLALAPALVGAGAPGIRSTKLDLLREHIHELAAEGHRALVFSQFTSYLDLVRADLEAHGIAYEYLDGSTRQRGEVIDRFRSGDAPVFLISLKAGGFGLTLTEADYVFLLDPWWNPAAEAQAVDRTHRIGQTRPVNVYRLVADGTIEEKVLALQQRKARLFHSVLGDDDALARSLTAEDIRDLLSD